MLNLQRTIEGERLPALDGLRALAVGVVILGHAGIPAYGDLGVAAFFVLSGFLITWLLIKEIRATGTVSLRSFYARRTLRIFPAYYVFLALSLIADTLLGDPRTREAIGPAALYLTNYYNAFNDHPPSSIAHGWSLAIEEQFYLLWPVTFLFLWRRGPDVVIRGLTALIVAALIWRCTAYYAFGAGSAYLYNAFETRMDFLATGCLLALCVERPRFRAFARRIVPFALSPLVTIALLYWVRTSIGILHYGPGFTVQALLLALLIVQLLQLVDTRQWRWLEHPVTRYLGRISYPLYLYHLWGLAAAENVPAMPRAGTVLLGIGVSIALAAASYHIVEMPFLRLKRRFRRVRPVPAPATAGTAPRAAGAP